MEVWKPISGYDGYEVSNLGRVRSCKYGDWRILKPYTTNVGYLLVTLCRNGKRKYCTIHRLVATEFIPNSDNKPFINHINGIKTDNCVANLEWCTPSENNQHAVDIGLHKQGADNSLAKLTNEQVEWIREHYIPRDKKFGQEALAGKFNVARAVIEAIVHGERYKNAGGKIAERFDLHKLTPAQIREIRQMYVRGSSEFGTVALAKIFGVNPSTINDIINHKTYKEVI